MMSIILALKSVVFYGFYGSFKIGQFIVTVLNLTLTNLICVINKLLTLLAIILEDFTIFLQDLLQRIQYLLRLTTYFMEFVVFGGNTLLEKIQILLQLIWTSISTILDGIFDGVAATFSIIGSIFVFIKHAIILFGDGVWFIVIFIPESMMSLGPLAVYYLNQLCIHIFSYICVKSKQTYNFTAEFMKNCYHFVTDVPVESIIGILIAVCFVYIFILMYLRNIFSSLKIGLELKYNQLKRMLTRIARQIRQKRRQEFEYKPSTSHKSTNDNVINDRSCIACKDRDKCILVLPCKHLCLCSECTAKVMHYGGRCPICRKRINRTMKIFT